MRSLILAMSIVLCLSGSTPASADSVERRGTEPRLDGEITAVDEAGVSLRSASGADYFVPWDRVRTVDSRHAAEAVKQYHEDAENLWRARTRLERGDTVLAAPLFERLFEKYRGRTHETALVVAEGLLRCRLARGEHEAAVVPALEAARIRLKGIKTASYAQLPPVIDPTTSLCISLAPVWASAAATSKLERDLAAYDPLSEPIIVSLRSEYRRAARLQLNLDIAADEKPPVPEHPGVKLLHALVQTQAKDSSEREVARARLRHDMPAMPLWAQAWAQYMLGVSLLMEPGTGRQQAGLVSLVHLPASYADSQAYLAGLALARLISWYEARGEASLAATLRTELQTRYPLHSVLATMPMAATQPARITPAAPDPSDKESS